MVTLLRKSSEMHEKGAKEASAHVFCLFFVVFDEKGGKR